MNQLPRLGALTLYDSVIDDVIANMSGAFQDDGVDESTLQKLQKLKRVWRFKVQKSFQEDPTDATKEDAKEEPVTSKLAAVAVTGAAQLGIKWKLHEIDLSEVGRCPPVRRWNMALGNAMQLDGGLSPIEEESSDEEDAEMLEAEPLDSNDDEPLNSNDDLSGEEAAEDAFDSDNVIVCQYNKVSHMRQNWKFELCNGVMTLNGKDYVFKELTGQSEF